MVKVKMGWPTSEDLKACGSIEFPVGPRTFTATEGEPEMILRLAIETATGEALDALARFHKVEREAGETDESLRRRAMTGPKRLLR